MAKNKRNMQNECYSCEHRRTIPGDTHTKCDKPDPNMKGSSYGASQGWFVYPYNFDPAWKEVDCTNYKEK